VGWKLTFERLDMVGVRQVERTIMFPIISFPIFDYYSCLSTCTIILIVVESSAVKQTSLKLSLDALLIFEIILRFHRLILLALAL